MNSFVNVQVRVLAGQAMSQLAAMQAQLNGLSKSHGRASAAAHGFGLSLGTAALDTFGSRVQWIGRQLEYNFTLPVLAASAASMKLALDNERAFTRIEKVYGDATHGADMYSKELAALKENFKALSNAYGVNQTEVLGVAASWAQAGASGIALAKSVDLTMKTMILGELQAAEATEALIAIQAQYGQTVDELTKTIAILNMVENQTGIGLKGLIEGFARAAGVARDAGVDVRHLAAMLAALTPAAGSAAQAGNAIKTILSRLIAPTEETVGLLREMNIETSSMAWKSADATGKLGILAKSFNELDQAQKNVVSSVIASRWQVNKFSILMRELTNANGYYQKALQATNTEQEVFVQMNKELQAVLSSNPRRLEILWTSLQNAMADIIQPLIPMLLWLTAQLAKLATAFSELNPGVQKLILFLLVALATVGPIVRIFGALVLLFAQLGVAVRLAIAPLMLLGTAFKFLLGTPIIGFLTAVGTAARVGLAAGLTAALAVVKWFGGQLAVALLTAAARAGVVWRAGMGLLATSTTAVTATIMVLWRRFWWTFTALTMAGARAAGIAYRAGLIFFAAATTVTQMVLLTAWRKLWAMLVLMTTAGWTAILGVFRKVIPALRAASIAVMAALSGPWGMAIAGVIVLVLAFWDELGQLWRGIIEGTIRAWNALPAGIANAMRAVVNIVYRAAMAVYEAMSWMNPWARHSPSLVENVTTGVAEIKRQYSSIDRISEIFRRAGIGLQEFGRIVERIKRIAQLQEIADQRKDIAAIAGDSIPLFNKLVSVLFPLRDLMREIGDQVNRQQAVVDKWKQKLDGANAALDVQQKRLDDLQKVAQKYQDQLSAAQAELDRFASAPIQGMKAMEDLIFANSMEQKRLRLEMMKMEEVVGPLDKLRGKIDAINGQMELLSGERNALRSAGAGSEILSQYDEEIQRLEQQKGAIEDQVRPIQDLSNQIDELGRRAEMLDLEKSLKFDPLKKQIDDLVNSMQEMPFEQILAGVIANKAKVDDLTVAYDRANAAVEAQQAVVDKLTAARDAIQASYDAESAKLQALQDEYSNVESKVRDIESALNDMAGAARAAAAAAKEAAGGGRVSPGVQNFRDAAGGNFPDPGGFAQIGREGGWGDQSKMIDEFTKEMQEKTKNLFGAFDFLEPIKKGWNKAWGWVKENIGGPIGEVFGGVKDKLSGMNPFEGMGSWLDTIKSVGKGIWDAMKMVWDVIGPEVIEVGKQAWAGLQDAFKDIQPEIAKFRDLVGPMGEALKNIWTILKPVLMVVLGLILAVVKALISGIGGAIGPIIRGIGDLIAGIIKIFRGLLEFFTGVWTLDWELMWTGIKDIFSGIWQAIWGVLKNLGNALWGLVKGIVMGIVDFFVWLWDVLVGHSIIPDMVNAIINWFKQLWDKCVEFVKGLAQGVMNAWKNLWNEVQQTLQIAKALIEYKVAELKKAVEDKWNALKEALRAAWEWVWNQIKAKIDWARGQIDNAINGIRTILDKVRTGWNSIVDAIRDKIDDLVSRFNSMRNRFSFSGMFDGIRSAFASAINWVIGKWNGLNFPGISVAGQQLVPGFGTPDIPYLAKGARIAQATLAMIGEGRRGYPEYVIPTDPNHRRRAMVLFNQLANDLGVAGGGHVEARIAAEAQHGEGAREVNINIYGNLEFPNVKTSDDADKFIRHLESLAGGGSE